MTVILHKSPVVFCFVISILASGTETLSPKLGDTLGKHCQDHHCSRSVDTMALRSGSVQARLVTYNVLSSHLCRPEEFKNNSPDHLDANNRLKRVKKKLAAEMSAGAVIALQEVSITWSGHLHTFFEKHEYTYIKSQYGKPFNNYMGVGIAFPRGKFSLEETNIQRISDTRKWANTRKPDPSWFDWAKSFFATPERVVDVHAESRRRFNTMVALRLKHRDSGKELVVGTYHMPCAFWAPQVMTMHTALAVKHLQRLAGSRPHVLLGDFNFKPGSTMYDLVTKGTVDKSSDECPKPQDADDEWRPTLPHPMKSAYAVVNGSEPCFTNWNQSRENPEFKDTLDYIFFAGSGLKPTEVLKLPEEDKVGPYPTLEQPSDHVMLAATFAL